jgi:hypothetical protein
VNREILLRIGRYALIVLGFAVVFGTHFFLTTYYLDHSHMGADEGFYAIAARNALDGQLPYRDYAYTQMPLLPYWNGLAMEVVGYGLFNQRACNVVWSFIGLLGIVLAMRQRLGRWEPGLVAAFCVAASPHFAELQSIGTSHGAAGMFLSLAGAVVLTTYPLKWRALAFGFLGTMAVGTRLSVGPVVGLLEIILIIEASGWRQRAIAVAVPAAFAAAGLLPFLIAAPDAMLFNVWEYHMASVFDRRSLDQAVEWWRNSPAAILMLLAGLCGLPRLIKNREWSLGLLLVAALCGIGLPMLPQSAYGLYAVPAMGLAAAAGLTAMWKVGVMDRNPFRHVIWILPAIVLFHPLPRTVESTSYETEMLALYLEEKIPPGPILTPTPIVAVQAGREVIPNTNMGMFAAVHPKDREIAERFHYTTIPELIEIVEREEPVAIVKMKGSSRWNFKWTIPTLRRQPQGVYRQFEKAMRDHYRVATRRKHMEILVPKK